MFDSAKEYLDKGIGQKIIGLLITLLITYGLIWQLIEPLISSTQLFPKNVLDWWWQIQLLSTLIVGTAIFFLLLPKKVLQSMGFEVQDTKLNNGWNVHKGNPKLQTSQDGYYGDVLYIQSNFDTDAIDTDVQASAQEANSVQYIFQPIKRFVFYLHLNVISTTGGRPQDVWVPLRTDITKPIGDKNGIEIAYPANAKNAKNGWLASKVNIHKVVKETFGHSDWKYLNLIGFRIKGEGRIQKIIIR